MVGEIQTVNEQTRAIAAVTEEQAHDSEQIARHIGVAVEKMGETSLAWHTIDQDIQELSVTIQDHLNRSSSCDLK